ncbi:MAG: hypothetical protein ABJA98_02635 [Acidobacteriota bacterium]
MDRVWRIRRRAVSAIIIALGLGLVHAQEKPLPDLDSVLKGLRKTLHTDRVLLSQYTYTEKTIQKNLDKKGTVTKTEVEVSEVYPSLDQELSYIRVISKNGTPTDPKELEKKDREQQKKVLERMGKAERDSAAQKEKRQAKIAEEQRKENEAIDEAFALYAVSMKGREVVDGRDAIVVDFRPKPDFKARSDNGKTLKKITGRAWIDERDHELIRIELNLEDTISIGFGVLARLNPGAHALYQRRLVNNEIWLPAEVRYTGSARVMLFKGIRLDVASEYSGYKKFSVDTATTFSGPKPSQ